MLREFIASQFKKPAGLFGIFSSNVMTKGNWKKYERLMQKLDPTAEDKILEIGYGPGVGIKMIAERCSTGTIHGVDFSRLMYKRASKYNKQYIDGGRVRLMFGDFVKMPVEEKDYDKIFCINVIYFWDELSTPFTKVYSLLKQGGCFLIYMANKALLEEKKAPDTVFNKYSIEQVTEALKAAGFASVEYSENEGYYIEARK
jgi:ubiquinone/menaquinone biosynthesis C-methylase UbiE